MCYYTPWKSFKKDKKEALSYYKESAELKNSYALYKRSCYYINEKHQDFNK